MVQRHIKHLLKEEKLNGQNLWPGLHQERSGPLNGCLKVVQICRNLGRARKENGKKIPDHMAHLHASRKRGKKNLKADSVFFNAQFTVYTLLHMLGSFLTCNLPCKPYCTCFDPSRILPSSSLRNSVILYQPFVSTFSFAPQPHRQERERESRLSTAIVLGPALQKDGADL